jgi:competence protein ComEC
MFFALGILRLDLATVFAPVSVLESSVGQLVELKGVVVREPDVREKSTQLTVKVGQELILVSVDRYASVSYGDEVKVRGKLAQPTAFETDFGRTFNYPGYLQARGVSYTMSFASLSITATNRGNQILSWLYANKQHFTKVLQANIPEPYVGLSEGLLLGIKQALGADLENAFRRTGIIHVVVLSGYNVMLVVAFVMYILSVFLSVRWRSVVGVIAVISFALLVGLSATVVRASIMAVLVLIAEALGRGYLVMRGLFLAGVVMLIINPYLLVYDVGFQLSFVATLGLILVAPQFETLLVRVPTTIGVRGFLLATIATQIAVAPLLLYQMGQFSLVAVIVNVLVLPAVPFAMLFTFITGLLAMVYVPLAVPFAYIAYLLLMYIISIATWFSSLSWAAFTVPAFSFYFVPISYLLMAGIFYFVNFKRNEASSVKLATDISDWTIVPEFDVEINSEGKRKREIGREQSSRPISPTPTPPPTNTVDAEAKVPIFFR